MKPARNPQKELGVELVLAFLLALLIMAAVALMAQSCGLDDKNKDEYDRGYYDGYWKAQGEHGIL